MDSTLSTIIKSAAFLFTGGLFYYRYRQMEPKKKQLQSLQREDLKGIQSIQKLKEGESRHIKAKIKKDSRNECIKEIINNPLYYNQYYLEEPSDILVIKNLQNKHQDTKFERSQFILIDSQGKQIKVRGIREIVGDVYNINKKYEKFESGALKKCWGVFCYYIELFFNLFRKSKIRQSETYYLPEKRKPFILGPVIGMLHYSVGILTDSFFVLKVKLENGFHRVEVLAESKNALLGEYQLQLFGARFQSAVLGLGALILGYMLYRDVRKWFRIHGIVKSFVKSRKKLLQVENVNQDKACIICFTNCRNLVFFDCKHLIMCWDCFKSVKQDNCPICKKQISEAKIVEENKQERISELKEKEIVSDGSIQQKA